MKKKVLAMLLTGIVAISMVGCGSDNKVKDTSGGTTTTKEDNKDKNNSSTKKLSEKELKEKYERVRDKLIEFLKANNVEVKEYGSDIKGKAIGKEIDGDIGYTINLRDKYEDGYIYIDVTSSVELEKFEKSDFDVDIDNSIIPKIYDIFKEESGFKYGEHGVKLQEALMNNSKSTERTKGYEDIIVDGDYTQKIDILPGEGQSQESVFGISMILGKN